MKRITLLMGCLLLSAAALSAAVKGNAVLAWDYPAVELSTNLTFKLYSTTNTATFTNVVNGVTNTITSGTNWAVITNIVGTNLSVTVPVQPGWRYFYVTASNEFGESDPSNVAAALVPRRGDRLRITPAE